MTLTVTFHSHYEAIKANKRLIAMGYEVKLISVPRSLSSDCGTAALTDCPAERIGEISPEGAYYEEEGKWRRVYGPSD